MEFGHRVRATDAPGATQPRVTSAGHAGTRGDGTRLAYVLVDREVV